MYALYKKDKCPNQMKINYISYDKNKATVVYTISGARAELLDISFNAQFRPSGILNHTNKVTI